MYFSIADFTMWVFSHYVCASNPFEKGKGNAAKETTVFKVLRVHFLLQGKE